MGQLRPGYEIGPSRVPAPVDRGVEGGIEEVFERVVGREYWEPGRAKEISEGVRAVRTGLGVGAEKL